MTVLRWPMSGRVMMLTDIRLVHWLRLLSGLADPAVILPLALIITVMLFGIGERRAALWWILAITAALGGALFAKLIFIPCGWIIPSLEIRSPSGNVAATAAVYGGLVMLFMQSRRRASDWGFANLLIPMLWLLALVAAMAISRVITRAHTVPETIAGALIGSLAPLLIALPRRLFVGATIPRFPWLVLVPLIAVALLFGAKAHIERPINLLAIHLASRLNVCVESNAGGLS